jgi:hypothetical protein
MMKAATLSCAANRTGIKPTVRSSNAVYFTRRGGMGQTENYNFLIAHHIRAKIPGNFAIFSDQDQPGAQLSLISIKVGCFIGSSNMLRVVCIILCTGCFLVMGGIVRAAWIDPISPTIEIPAALKPGSPIPGYVTCEEWSAYNSYAIQYCHDGDVYLSYDPDRGIITRASTYVYSQAITLGQLVVAWGTPTGYKHEDRVLKVFWRDCYAYLTDSGMSPANRVVVVGWGLHNDSDPWRGFVTLHSQ